MNVKGYLLLVLAYLRGLYAMAKTFLHWTWCWLRTGHIMIRVGDDDILNATLYQCLSCEKKVAVDKRDGHIV